MAQKISSEMHELGFEIRQELWGNTPMTTAYTVNGDPVGDIGLAKRLYERGILPEKMNPTDSYCQIGFCEKEQKWYGWSHRTICGFKIGDRVKKGDIVSELAWTEEYLLTHPEADKSLPIGFVAKTLNDCRLMAIAFADAVS